VIEALLAPGGLRRGGLFGLAAAAHVLLLSLLPPARMPAPPGDDRLIAVDLLPLAPPGAGPAAPQAGGPESAPPVRPAMAPAAPTVAQPVAQPEPLPVKKPSRPARPKKTVAAMKSLAPPPPAAVASSPLPEAVSPGDVSPGDGGEASATPGDAIAAAGHGGPPGGGTGQGAAPGGGGGGGESPARFDADYLRNPAPPYPPQSRRLREEGEVLLRVRVMPEGRVGGLELNATSGSARLDASALKTVRQWRFIPARRGGQNVESWVLVPILFKLEQ
jgi:protein TonB